jgi:hypothetical protein
MENAVKARVAWSFHVRAIVKRKKRKRQALAFTEAVSY